MKDKYTGGWYALDKKEYVKGILTIDEKDGIVLEVDGVIKNNGIINGVSNDNKKITLQGCIQTYSSFGTAGCICKYTCSVVYVGETYDKIEDIKFDQFSFSTSNLNDWLWNRSFSFDRNEENKTFTVNYSLPEPIIAKINEQYSIQIETSAILPPISIPQYEIEIKEKPKVKICSTSAEPLDAFLRLEYIFECFLKIAIGTNQNRYEMCGYRDGKKVEIYLSRYIIYKDRDVSPMYMPFHFHLVRDKWEKVIASWYENYEKYEDIWNLYFSVNNNTKNFIQHSFLFYVQVLESYHRRKYKSDRTEEKNKIKALIQECPIEHQEFLSGALNFAHEITLKERLEELCKECDIMDIILNTQYRIDQATFVKVIKDNRNYYTHYDESMEKKKSEYLILHYITVKINIMIHFFLLKELGFDENERFEILKRLDRELMIDEDMRKLDAFVEQLTEQK